MALCINCIYYYYYYYYYYDYDVTTLFTSIPVDDVLAVVKEKLEQDTKLQGRCKLSIHQIVVLLEFSLNTTYFVLRQYSL